MQQGIRAGVLAFGFALALVGSASGGTVQVDRTAFGDPCGTANSIAFFAGPGEVNKLTLTQADAAVDTGIGFIGPCNYWATRMTEALVSDPGAALRAGRGCTLLTRAQAACGVAGGLDTLLPATIELGDNRDYLAWSIGIPAVVAAGPGDDQLRMANGAPDTVDCGEGLDTVTADGTDRLAGCETVSVTNP